MASSGGLCRAYPVSEAKTEQRAIQELVDAEADYDLALAELRASGAAGAGDHPLVVDEAERMLRESRATALTAASQFEETHRLMVAAQGEFDKALGLLETAREVARRSGRAWSGSLALERAKLRVLDGRARLVAAGRALRDARQHG